MRFLVLINIWVHGTYHDHLKSACNFVLKLVLFQGAASKIKKLASASKSLRMVSMTVYMFEKNFLNF